MVWHNQHVGSFSLPLDSTLLDHMQLRDTPHPRYVWPCSCIVVCQGTSVFFSLFLLGLRVDIRAV